MKQELISLLETFGYPVYLQGSLASVGDYPESFFTFWNFTAQESAFYDNDANRCVWGFWVYFYSTDPQLVLEKTELARKLLKQNGFIPDGKPVDLSTDAPEHTGAMFAVYKMENYEEE